MVIKAEAVNNDGFSVDRRQRFWLFLVIKFPDGITVKPSRTREKRGWFWVKAAILSPSNAFVHPSQGDSRRSLNQVDSEFPSIGRRRPTVAVCNSIIRLAR